MSRAASADYGVPDERWHDRLCSPLQVYERAVVSHSPRYRVPERVLTYREHRRQLAVTIELEWLEVAARRLA
jgi:hypothetical protein